MRKCVKWEKMRYKIVIRPPTIEQIHQLNCYKVKKLQQNYHQLQQISKLYIYPDQLDIGNREYLSDQDGYISKRFRII